MSCTANDTFNNRENTTDQYTFDEDFKLCINDRDIPITTEPLNIPFGILGLCIEGSATIEVYLQRYEINKGDLMVILPNQLVSIKEKSDDFCINYYAVSQSLINDAVSGVSRLSPLFFIHMRRKHHYKLSEVEFYRFYEYYNLIYSRIKLGDPVYEKEYITNILKLFYLDLYNSFKSSLSSTKLTSDARKEKLTYDFFLLIMENFRTNREVLFYADKLCITPKYLSTVVKEVSLRPAKDWIIEYIMMELKYLLKNSSYNIQEMALRTNFSNQASLGRFFRKHTGMSPSQYRTLNRNKNRYK